MKKIILLISLFIFSTAIIAESAELIHLIRFSDYESGSEKDWLLKKGFEYKLDARDRTRIDFNPSNKGLVIQAKRKALGIISNEVDIPEFTYVEIDWGGNKHPQGASYEQGVRNEAIMVNLQLLLVKLDFTIKKRLTSSLVLRERI